MSNNLSGIEPHRSTTPPSEPPANASLLLRWRCAPTCRMATACAGGARAAAADRLSAFRITLMPVRVRWASRWSDDGARANRLPPLPGEAAGRAGRVSRRGTTTLIPRKGRVLWLGQRHPAPVRTAAATLRGRVRRWHPENYLAGYAYCDSVPGVLTEELVTPSRLERHVTCKLMRMNPRLRNGLLAGAIALVVYLLITMVLFR